MVRAMSNKQPTGDDFRWKRIGRRWTAGLCATLAINAVLIGLAVRSFANSALEPFQANSTAAFGNAPAPETDVVAPNHPGSVDEDSATSSADQTSPPPAGNVAVVDSESMPVPEPRRPSVDEPAGVVDSGREDTPARQPPVAMTGKLPADEPKQPLNSPDHDAADRIAPKHLDNWDSVQESTTALVIINPPTTGGVVHYVVDGKVH